MASEQMQELAALFRPHQHTHRTAPEILRDGFVADFLMRNISMTRD
jgi:hypothetical protein